MAINSWVSSGRICTKKKKRKKEEDWVSILEVFDTYGYDTHWIQMREKIGVFVHPSNKLSETNLNWSLD